ncbi:SDR family oxidoreductase [Reichenbachiella versicolor]|uniref:SDR family oxidoreductase n=1 Tax=Reichenbachiella versicolor TaxID=1821036 RepID=UPI000D6E09FE|nr:SDR family oxidoreductase [Reichenbachiella versicolor]
MKDKVAVVTGGSGVLCSVMAKHLSLQGFKIALIGRTLSKLENVANEIKETGGTVLAIAADVLDKDALLSAHQSIKSELGTCDVLINGAGGNHPDATTSMTEFDSTTNEGKGFFDLDHKAVGGVFDLNFLGTFLPSQIFGKDMIGKEGCSIINLSSMSAYSPMTKVMAYSAAKAAISNFTEWMAVHFASAGIRVNAIAPGFFLTDQNRALLTNSDGSLTDRGNTILSQTPMKRFGKPEELVGTLEWLIDDSSTFITGIVVPVDGGFNAFSGV